MRSIIIFITLTLLWSSEIAAKDFGLESAGFIVDRQGSHVKIEIEPRFWKKNPNPSLVKNTSVDSAGSVFYVVKPGYEIVTLRSLESADAEQMMSCIIVSGSTDRLWSGEKVFLSDSEAKASLISWTKVKSIFSSSGTSDPLPSYHAALSAWSNRDFKKCRTYFESALSTSPQNHPLRAEMIYRFADLFHPEFRRIPFHRGLEDPTVCRVILLFLAEMFPPDNPWVSKANYRLSEMYINCNWRTKNHTSYGFLRKAGPIGEVFLNYGKNLLTNLPQDSILITEGGDNQVFSLQMLLQIEGLRPDVTVYDQKGNIFDQIYGNLRSLSASELSDRQISSDRMLITTGQPPEITEIRSFQTEERVFRKRTGPVFYSWRPTDRINAINNLQAADRLPLYQLLQKGILYQILPQSTSTVETPSNEIWQGYKFDWDREACLDFPYLIREIIANYEFQIADSVLARTRNFDNALPHYMEACRIGYDMVPLFFNTGIFTEQESIKRWNEGQKEDALRLLRIAIKHYRQSADLPWDAEEFRPAQNCGNALMRYFDWCSDTEALREAEAFYKRASKIAPKEDGPKKGLELIKTRKKR